MRYHSEELGIEKELYGLFVCMVTGRPWDSIMKGVQKTKPTEDEVFINITLLIYEVLLKFNSV